MSTDYEQFEKDWKKRHKASLPRRMQVSSFSTIFWIAFWIIVASGAAVFSGTHTIPTTAMTIESAISYRSELAITAFVIVEFVIFGTAAKRHEINWLKWLMGISLAVGLIANVSSSFTAVSHNGGDWLTQIAGVLLSVIAPVTALAAGEVLHIQLTALALKQKEANEDFQRQWKEVDAKINAAFTKLEKEAKAQNEVINSLNLIKNNDLTRSKPSPRLQKAIDYLELNPDKLNLPPRELEAEVGVSYGTIFKAQQQIKQSANGHSEDSN